jgi:succinate dehydrogenase/fumarate reductase flavoprotein subunit
LQTANQRSPNPGARTVDVLIVGAGAAGMTAALCLRQRGMRVLVVESTSQVGGTTSTSAGTLWLPCAEAKAQDVAACAEAARTYLRACIGEGADERKIDALIATGPELLAFLRAHTDVQLDMVATHPDYLQHLPGATMGGRAFAPREFDGRLLGADFARIRAPLPEFMVFGGMMVSKADIPMLLSATRNAKAFIYSAKLLMRYGMDRVRGRRGTRLVMGNALVARLFSSIRRMQIEIAFETTVAKVERAASGFECTLTGSATGVVHVSKGVILATGGFSGSAAMRQRWLPPAAQGHSVAHMGNAGGGIALAQSLGAATELDHAQPALWMPVSTMRRPDASLAIFPHIVLDRAKPGCLAVDSSAQRFVNEADAYHHFCEAMLRVTGKAPDARFYLIADMAFVHRYGLGMVRPGRVPRAFEDSGYLMRARSPEALAARLGLDPVTLASTLARYNANAARGEDPDFGRGTSAFNRFNGDAEHAPNPCLRALDTSDLCAVALHVADLATSVGLATDEDARILDSAGLPIEGLFACGNDMASMMRGSYPGPGTTLGPGMVFALRAAARLAR